MGVRFSCNGGEKQPDPEKTDLTTIAMGTPHFWLGAYWLNNPSSEQFPESLSRSCCSRFILNPAVSGASGYEANRSRR